MSEAKGEFPKICELCEKEIGSRIDLDWHGLGNCVPICETCNGSGIAKAGEPKICYTPEQINLMLESARREALEALAAQGAPTPLGEPELLRVPETDDEILIWYERLEKSTINTVTPEQHIIWRVRELIRLAAKDRVLRESHLPDDPVGCGCDEFPECTHALYFYMGTKHAATLNAAALAAQGAPGTREPK
jgi:hypothetical protein